LCWREREIDGKSGWRKRDKRKNLVKEDEEREGEDEEMKKIIFILVNGHIFMPLVQLISTQCATWLQKNITSVFFVNLMANFKDHIYLIKK
jgi:hypothetical protein